MTLVVLINAEINLYKSIYLLVSNSKNLLSNLSYTHSFNNRQLATQPNKPSDPITIRQINRKKIRRKNKFSRITQILQNKTKNTVNECVKTNIIHS